MLWKICEIEALKLNWKAYSSILVPSGCNWVLSIPESCWCFFPKLISQLFFVAYTVNIFHHNTVTYPIYHTCANKGRGINSKNIFDGLHYGTFHRNSSIFNTHGCMKFSEMHLSWEILNLRLLFKNILYCVFNVHGKSNSLQSSICILIRYF